VGLAVLGYTVLPFLPYGRYKLLLAGIIDDPKVRVCLKLKRTCSHRRQARFEYP
jgi:hypothetical protein